MDLHLREQLHALIDRLQGHDGPGADKASKLGSDLKEGLEQSEPGLSGRLAAEAVEFEAEHPDLASAIRRVADALSAGGL